MASPTTSEIIAFGSLIRPFERNTRGKTADSLKEAHKIKTIESGIGDKIYDATNDGLPHYPLKVFYTSKETITKITKRQLELEQKKIYCFLWVLDNGGIKIMWENVRNELDAADKEVKHTNITGGGEAFHGGELFIARKKRIFLNNSSDRYGDSGSKEWKAVIKYFKKVYKKYEIIDLENGKKG